MAATAMIHQYLLLFIVAPAIAGLPAAGASNGSATGSSSWIV